MTQLKLSVDLAVIGAGPSGLAAALRATEFGLQVALFEKTGTFGGVYNGGMGPFGADTHIQHEYGKVDGTAERAFNYLFDFTHGTIDARLASEFIRKSAFTVKWLEDYGVKYADPNRLLGVQRIRNTFAMLLPIIQNSRRQMGATSGCTSRHCCISGLRILAL